MSQVKGIDISSWQGNISDLGADLDFVIIKATEGTGYVNADLAEQVAVVRRDHKRLGFYHFTDLSDANAEAQHFINTIKPYLQTGDFFALDWETGSYSDSVDAWCAQFSADVHNAFGVPPFLYSNAARVNSGSWPKTRAQNDGLWEAAYGSNAPSPAPWPFMAIWQQTSSGQEQGVGGAVDVDYFFGDDTQLGKYCYGGPGSVQPNAPSAAPVPAPAPTPSGGSVSVRSGDTLSAIAAAHGVSLAALEGANPQISNPNLIYPGETIHLPGGSQAATGVGRVYHVVAGDTLSGIAVRFGESLATIVAKNPQIPNKNLIYPGEAVNI